MAIWGNRGREPEAEEAPAEVAPAATTPGNGPPPEAPAPPASEAPAGTGAPAQAEDGAVMDAEAAVKDPARAETAGDPGETAGDPAKIAGGPAAAEGRPDPGVIQAPGAAAATQEPAAAATQEPAAAAASPASPDSPGNLSPQRWSEILVAFVDDPRGSVTMAADAVDAAIEEVVTSIRARQRALASSWQGSEADTEQLRIVLREYRRFGSQIQQVGPAGGKTAAGS